jgi:hypothetical protein
MFIIAGPFGLFAITAWFVRTCLGAELPRPQYNTMRPSQYDNHYSHGGNRSVSTLGSASLTASTTSSIEATAVKSNDQPPLRVNHDHHDFS